MNQLFGLSDQAWLYIDQVGILLGILVGVASLGAAFVAIAKRSRLRNWLLRNRFPTVSSAGTTVEWDGLLLLVSRFEMPFWLISQKPVKAIALLASDESKHTAEQLATAARQSGVVVIGPSILIDPDDAHSAKRLAASGLSALLAAGCECPAVDITGGKTPMSIGAFMAAEEQGATSIYVASRYDPALKQADPSTARVQLISRPMA